MRQGRTRREQGGMRGQAAFLAVALLAVMLAGCPAPEKPSKQYPGFTRVEAPGAPGKYFLDPESVRLEGEQTVFRMLTELPEGDYIVAHVATDGRGNYLRTAASRHRADDSLVETLPGDREWQRAEGDPGLQAVLRAVGPRRPPVRGLTGQIDAGKAMHFLFGNFDAARQTSRWEKIALPKELADNDYFRPGVAGLARPLLAQLYEEDKQIKFMLLTQTRPAGERFDCHACAPLLSGFVFVHQEETWVLETEDRYITFAGKYGEGPEAKLAQIGPTHFGVICRGSDVNQGYSSAYAFVLAPRGGKFRELINLDLGGDNEGAVVAGKKDKDYWAYRAEYEFVPGSEAAFYDLKVITRGTRQGPKGKKLMADRTDYYVFQGDGYMLRPGPAPGARDPGR